MFITQVLLGLLVALLLAGVFVPVLGWRPRGDGSVTAGWAFFMFFVGLFLVTWAGGVWLAPLGPTLYGAPWVGFLIVGLVAALLAAVLTPASPPTPGGEFVPRNGRVIRQTGLAGIGALSLLLVLLLVIVLGAKYV